MTSFSVGRYYDQDTNRYRWAVLGPSGVWYFPARYGLRVAKAMCNRMNKEVLGL